MSKRIPRTPRSWATPPSFLTCSDKAKCGELLRRARSLEPDNPEWSRRLGHLYSLQMIGKDAAARRDWAAMAQAEYERGQGLYRDERERLGQLPNLADAAFEAGDYAKARTYASELLSRADAADKGKRPSFTATRSSGDSPSSTAMCRGPRRHLLASAETNGSPVPMQFRTEHGACQGVTRPGRAGCRSRYLERCSSFWQYGADELSQWAAAIERGETPDFGPLK